MDVCGNCTAGCETGFVLLENGILRDVEVDGTALGRCGDIKAAVSPDDGPTGGFIG